MGRAACAAAAVISNMMKQPCGFADLIIKWLRQGIIAAAVPNGINTAKRVCRHDNKADKAGDHCSGGACAATQPGEEPAGKWVQDGIRDCSAI